MRALMSERDDGAGREDGMERIDCAAHEMPRKDVVSKLRRHLVETEE